MYTRTESGARARVVPIGNGGITDRYYWTQTIYETTVYIELPLGTSSRDVLCSITPSRLSVGLKGEAPVLDGALPYKINASDSMWNLEVRVCARACARVCFLCVWG